jgi:hypothetical protein
LQVNLTAHGEKQQGLLAESSGLKD